MKSTKVDPYAFAHKPAYSLPNMEEHLLMDLSREIERNKDPDYVSISWASQVEASEFINSQGFEKALTYLVELEQK